MYTNGNDDYHRMCIKLEQPIVEFKVYGMETRDENQEIGGRNSFSYLERFTKTHAKQNRRQLVFPCSVFGVHSDRTMHTYRDY